MLKIVIAIMLIASIYIMLLFDGNYQKMRRNARRAKRQQAIKNRKMKARESYYGYLS